MKSTTSQLLGLTNGSSNKTKDYLFDPVIVIYYGIEVKELFMLMNVKAVYLNDTSTNNRIDDNYLYVVVDHTNPLYSRALESLRSYTALFKAVYAISEKYSVVVFKTIKGKVMHHFLNSEYSKMYPKDALIESADYFRESTLDGNISYTRVFKVLRGDEEYRKLMAQFLGVPPDLIQELDSAVKLKDEVFNSTTYKNK